MAWIELHQTLPTHRKTLAAAEMLNIAPVHFMGHLVAFWLWALDNVPHGDISQLSSRTIARAAQWEDSPESFIDALLAAGFVSRSGDSTSIHDWHEYAGKLISRRVAERDRQNQRRMAQTQDVRSDVRSTNAVHTQDIRSTNAVRTAYVRKKYCGTVPYSTVPNNIPPIVPPRGDESMDSTMESLHAGESLCVETATGEPRQVSPSKTRKQRRIELSSSQQLLFEEFWSAWPNKVSKGQAEATWANLNPDKELTERILAAIKRAIRHDKRFQPGGYTPHASTWLNASGWQDEHGAALARSQTGRMQHQHESRSTYDETEIILRRIKRQQEEGSALENIGDRNGSDEDHQPGAPSARRIQ